MYLWMLPKTELTIQPGLSPGSRGKQDCLPKLSLNYTGGFYQVKLKQLKHYPKVGRKKLFASQVGGKTRLRSDQAEFPGERPPPGWKRLTFGRWRKREI
jgi:hypothetical protein